MSLDPDELRADDHRDFAVRVATPVAARATAGAGSFVAEALAVLGRSGRARDGADVTLTDRPIDGLSVVFPPADPALVGAVNRALAGRGVAWRFGPVVDGEWEIDGAVGPAIGASVYRRRRLEGTGPVLGRVGGDPWLVRSENVILVASRMEDSWTSLPITAAFVPFLDVLMNRIAASPSWILKARPGETVEIPGDARNLLTPSGALPIPAARQVTLPLSPGVYFLQGAGTDTVGAVEINHDPRESLLQPAEATLLRSSLGGDVQLLTDQGMDRELFSGARRAELAGAMLLLAILVALAEFGLSSAGGAAVRD